MLYSVRVVENRKEARDIHVIKVERPEGFEFLPGQFSILSPNGTKRAYSIANCPEEKEYLEFCIKRVPNGKVSPVLCSSKPGDVLELYGPFGDFVLNYPPKNHLLFVCVGTGIAPIKSMIEHLEKNGTKKTVTLIYGALNEHTIPYRSLLEKWCQKENFEVIITLSNPLNPEKWKGEIGFVQDVIRKRFETLRDFEIYICGSPQMVLETKKVCEELRARERRIKFESCILLENVNEWVHKLSEKIHSTFSALFHKDSNMGSKTHAACSDDAQRAVS
jgi:CDP-4-dehydro-6-deoxyglucose reductase